MALSWCQCLAGRNATATVVKEFVKCWMKDMKGRPEYDYAGAWLYSYTS
jgi:hypothetical protein